MEDEKEVAIVITGAEFMQMVDDKNEQRRFVDRSASVFVSMGDRRLALSSAPQCMTVVREVARSNLLTYGYHI